MKKITDKQYKEFQNYCYLKDNGKILTPEGLRFICSANDYNPEKIGQHFLDMLVNFYSTGDVSIVSKKEY